MHSCNRLCLPIEQMLDGMLVVFLALNGLFTKSNFGEALCAEVTEVYYLLGDVSK